LYDVFDESIHSLAPEVHSFVHAHVCVSTVVDPQPSLHVRVCVAPRVEQALHAPHDIDGTHASPPPPLGGNGDAFAKMVENAVAVKFMMLLLQTLLAHVEQDDALPSAAAIVVKNPGDLKRSNEQEPTLNVTFAVVFMMPSSATSTATIELPRKMLPRFVTLMIFLWNVRIDDRIVAHSHQMDSESSEKYVVVSYDIVVGFHS
jgi:hypothetical protein